MYNGVQKTVIQMGFGAWSLSHTILVLFGIAVFISQVGVYFYRTKQNDKKLDKQGEDLRLALKEQGETFFHAIERLKNGWTRVSLKSINRS